MMFTEKQIQAHDERFKQVVARLKVYFPDCTVKTKRRKLANEIGYYIDVIYLPVVGAQRSHWNKLNMFAAEVAGKEEAEFYMTSGSYNASTWRLRFL